MNSQTRELLHIKQWTRDEVLTAALICGVTNDEAEIYYLHYQGQGWKRANGQQITDMATHLQWCKVTGNLPQVRQEKGNSVKKLPQHFGKSCSNSGCAMPARHKTSGSYGDNFYCMDHIPKTTREQYAEQGYTRDDGSEL